MHPLIVTALLGFSTYLLACTSVDPLGRPVSARLEEDEQQLWKTVAKEEQALDRSGTLYEDQAINRYVNEVVQRLIGPQKPSLKASTSKSNGRRLG